MQDLIALVALLRYTDNQLSAMELRQRLIEGESPVQILESLHYVTRSQELAAQDVESWLRAGEHPLAWTDDAYPAQLRDVYDFPPVIFVRGQLVEDRGICVVGSRKASPAVLEATKEVTARLVADNWTVVSGLALGVDRAAHTQALASGGRTVAVLGNGIDQFYPAENTALQREIEARGLTVSQFWPGTKPAKAHFPMRNATMSGYGLATIIVSATENSGTRHQARRAASHGRPLVISRQVYEQTSWGRELAKDPYSQVEVANSAEQAVEQAAAMVDFKIADFALW